LETILAIKNLTIEIETDNNSFLAVENINFNLRRGEILGIVGESGCGKSITSLSILRLLSEPLKITGGQINYKNENLLLIPEERLSNIRGNEIAMIFQEPMTALNPVFRVGEQVEEVIMRHQPNVSKIQAKESVIKLFTSVGLSDPERCYWAYSHQLSGGMRQRVMIAMALICSPEVLIADEPTTALDVTIQAQILALLRDLQKNGKLSLLLITHDLGVVAEMCDRVLIMYAGKVVEEGTVEDIFYRARHPYTKGLLNSIPKISNGQTKVPMKPILGMVPSVFDIMLGCRFYDRCLVRQNRCKDLQPELSGEANHLYACHNPNSVEDVPNA
jgi:oligopeptide/dipeptide ABC transporter ATP-binding protein